jgi:hypothetical protein
MTKSSITLGYATNNWQTTTHAQLKQTEKSVKELGADGCRAAVNPDTGAVHWEYGSEALDYSTTNTLPDPRTTGHKPAKLKKELHEQLRDSSIVMGFDKLNYKWKEGQSREQLNEAAKLSREVQEKKLYGPNQGKSTGKAIFNLSIKVS